MTSSAIRQYPIEPIATHSPINKALAEALLESVAQYRTQLQGRRIWLACSGGRDSLALAALCLQLYRQGKLPFLPQLLHVDHGWQADSRYWAAHVTKWAQVQQLPCQVLQVKVQGTDEQAARQARYKAMRAHINQEDVLLLAHHADDQAETVLMRLIQGAGVNGLSGMQSWRVQEEGVQRNILWRPWLSVRRTVITAYAEQLKLPYIDDPTNDSGDNVRSGLRHEVLPLLSAYNTNVIENIARSAQLLTDAQASLSAQAEQDLQQTAISALECSSAQRVLDIDELHTLPIYRQRQLLHYWLTQDEPLPPSKQLVDDVLTLTQRDDHDHQTQLDWQGRTQQYSIRRYRQQLYRLGHTWLAWLTEPTIEQTHTLSESICSSISLRTGQRHRWQVEFVADAVSQLFSHLQLLLIYQDGSADLKSFISNKNNAKDKIALRITPLGRQQRVQTALATRPQSGKKLYQTLGIPVWLRDSLVVVSVINSNISINSDIDTDDGLPLLLLSPFESWALGVKKPDADKVGQQLASVIKNTLHIYD